MIEEVEIDCKDCNATFNLQHNLSLSRYEIGFCILISLKDIEIEEGFENDEEEEDYY
jgi:hypothetical protein